MAKHTLHTNDLDFDFYILGISCAYNAYRIVYELNRALNIELALDAELDFVHKAGSNFKFALYSFVDDDFNVEYNLLPNKSVIKINPVIPNQANDLFSQVVGAVEESTLLLPELDQTDYFLLLKDDGRDGVIRAVKAILREQAFITVVQEIIPDKLSNRANLLF